MPFRNVMITVKITMGLPKRQFAEPGLSLSVTLPTLSHHQGITSQTPGVRRCPRRSARQTTATWCRWAYVELFRKSWEIYCTFGSNEQMITQSLVRWRVNGPTYTNRVKSNNILSDHPWHGTVWMTFSSFVFSWWWPGTTNPIISSSTFNIFPRLVGNMAQCNKQSM